MKIGFTGAGGTGKSTLLAIIREELEGDRSIRVLPSVARSVFAKFGAMESDQDMWSAEKRLELQTAIIDARLGAEYSAGDFVSDRTMVDHLAYTAFRCYDAMSDSEFDRLKSLTEENMREYDAVVYFPIHFVPAGDGMRQTGEAYRFAIDAIIKSLLRELNVVHYTVQAGTPQQNAELVMDYLNRKCFSIKTGDGW